MPSSENWQFDNSYARLPERFYARVDPVPVQQPELVVLNRDLARELGLTLDACSEEALAELFSGNRLPAGAEPIAQAYSGHQFGSFSRLGDGRAHLIGEHLTPAGHKVDIQFKGSGRTPYGRRGDGRAALGPMLREYILGEAMHGLGIPTTRGLAVVTTGEPVYRETALPGAILTRVAASHLRFGTFENLLPDKDTDGLRQLADYAIARHYPDLQGAENPYLEFLKMVMGSQIELVVQWLRVGFIHGVMNTDNLTISGETIDYGPCAFMDTYHPETVYSSIDHGGRYAYSNQPPIVQWNLARFAEALLPLLHKDSDQAVELATAVIESFNEEYQQAWLAMMRSKLGLEDEHSGDEKLIDTLLVWMQDSEADYTNTFRDLIAPEPPQGAPYRSNEFQDWWQRWRVRLEQDSNSLQSALETMSTVNPARIPRNHRVEAALSAAEDKLDFSVMQALLDALAEPYEELPKYSEFKKPPEPSERVLQTFCGT